MDIVFALIAGTFIVELLIFFIGLLFIDYILRAVIFKNYYKTEWWKGIIPFYNTYFETIKTFGAERWWIFLLLFVPYVDIFVAPVWLWYYVKSFNHGLGTFLLCLFLPPIGLAYITFSKTTKYLGIQSTFIDSDLEREKREEDDAVSEKQD